MLKLLVVLLSAALVFVYAKSVSASDTYYYCAVYTQEGMRFSDGSFDKAQMVKSVHNHCGMPANYTAVLLEGIDKEEAVR